MTAIDAALATVILLAVLLAIVAGYGIYANRKLQKEIDRAKENPKFKAVTRGIFEDVAIKKEYLGAFDKISHGEVKDDPG